MSHEHLSSSSPLTGRSSLALAAILALCGLLALLAFRPEASALTSPNDPWFPSQWALGKIRAPDAWDLTKGSASIKVAVVDTGIDSTHSDLQGQVGPGYNAITPGGSSEDEVGIWGRGTEMAGAIGAATNNGVEMAGLAWNITMLPVKACDWRPVCLLDDVAEGVNWAVNNGAKIIYVDTAAYPGDMTSPPNPLLDAAIANALSRGVLVVAPAGDAWPYGAMVAYPASIPGVIAVGATDSNDVVAGFSERGQGLDVTAPGVGIITLLSKTALQTSVGGTEVAAAHVSGALALLLAAGVPPSQAPGFLFQGARDLGPAGWDPDYGWGRLDVCGALTAAGIACPRVAATPTRTRTPVSTAATPTRTRTPVSTAATPTRTPTPVSPTPTRTRTPVPPTATPTPQTVVISGTLHKPSPTSADRALDLKAGQSVNARLTWTGSAALALYLYNPAGQLVAQGAGADNQQTLSHRAAAAGTYTLRVTLASGGWANYTLSITY